MARAIKRFRSVFGDTQQQFAARTGLSMTTIARYETGWYPKREVLASLGRLAKDNNLPVFVEIFERDLPAEPYLFEAELPALMGLLVNASSKLTATEADIDRGRIALSCLSQLPDGTYKQLKDLMESSLSPIDQLVEENAALVAWNRDPLGDAKFLAFLKQPSLEAGREYAEYTMGEAYALGFEKIWLDADQEAAIKYLKYFRLTFDHQLWENKSGRPRRPRPQ